MFLGARHSVLRSSVESRLGVHGGFKLQWDLISRRKVWFEKAPRRLWYLLPFPSSILGKQVIKTHSFTLEGLLTLCAFYLNKVKYD